MRAQHVLSYHELNRILFGHNRKDIVKDCSARYRTFIKKVSFIASTLRKSVYLGSNCRRKKFKKKVKSYTNVDDLRKKKCINLNPKHDEEIIHLKFLYLSLVLQFFFY